VEGPARRLGAGAWRQGPGAPGPSSRSAPQAHNFEGPFAHALTNTMRDCPLGGGRSAQMNFFFVILKTREFRNGATATKRR
jgi:hypothetical protein